MSVKGLSIAEDPFTRRLPLCIITLQHLQGLSSEIQYVLLGH